MVGAFFGAIHLVLYLLQVLLPLLLGQLDDVLLAGWALLPVDKPLAETRDMEDVVTDRNLHQLLVLLEEAEAKLALGLDDHVRKVAGVVKPVGLLVLERLVSYLIHDFEVDADHSFDCLDVLAVIFECAIGAVLESPVVRGLLLLAVVKNKTNQFHHDDQQEDKHRGWNQNQEDPVHNILVGKDELSTGVIARRVTTASQLPEHVESYTGV